MKQPDITVETFYTGQASLLELKLVAGAAGLKRAIREPTVNRPGLMLDGFHHLPVDFHFFTWWTSTF